MTGDSKNGTSKNSSSVTIPRNSSVPLRIAILGAPRTGKTSIINKIVTGNYSDTYYPLRKTTPILFTYRPENSGLKCIIDPYKSKEALSFAAANKIILSPIIELGLKKCHIDGESNGPNGHALSISKNSTYHVYSVANSKENVITPILTELIDTPGFEARKSVPFLEVSLHAKLAKADLRNLANDAGHTQTVNAEPLLVASGAAELNGAIDGYILVYSAVPPAALPSYDYDSQSSELPTDSSLDALYHIKEGLVEAWCEYQAYKARSLNNAESDIFSLKTAFKNMFDTRERRDNSFSTTLETIPSDPYDKLSLPPIIIVCTHKSLPLASPKLIKEGEKLARTWKSDFIAVDITENVNTILDFMVRELVERRHTRR